MRESEGRALQLLEVGMREACRGQGGVDNASCTKRGNDSGSQVTCTYGPAGANGRYAPPDYRADGNS